MGVGTAQSWRWGGVGGVGTAEAGSVLVLLLDEGLEVHHGVQLLGRVAQQTLQVAHEPVHIPAKIFRYRQKYFDIEEYNKMVLDLRKPTAFCLDGFACNKTFQL